MREPGALALFWFVDAPFRFVADTYMDTCLDSFMRK
jgi:hypothetical protein